jgi:hypothetical protein
MDTYIFSEIGIHCVIFVIDCFLANIVDPNFAWTTFTRAACDTDKRSRLVVKSTKTATAAPNTSTAPVSSTVVFSTDVLTAESNLQATPVMPKTTATLKPFLLWKSPFVASSKNPSNIHQLHNNDIVLASSSPLDALEFYRKLIAAAKPAEIDLVPISAFDPDHALWPQN